MAAVADDLPLKDGSVLRNVSIISAEPARMLIVHDGGGEYVAYSNLATNALTAAARAEVERLVRIHVERQARLEEARAIKDAEDRSMRQGGFVMFEGYWMQPADIEVILQTRRTAALEREKIRLEIAKNQAELDAQNARARQLLDANSSRGSIFIQTGSSRRYGGAFNFGCYHPYPVNQRRGPKRSR
jgi:hypothetical protein